MSYDFGFPDAVRGARKPKGDPTETEKGVLPFRFLLGFRSVSAPQGPIPFRSPFGFLSVSVRFPPPKPQSPFSLLSVSVLVLDQILLVFDRLIRFSFQFSTSAVSVFSV